MGDFYCVGVADPDRGRIIDDNAAFAGRQRQLLHDSFPPAVLLAFGLDAIVCLGLFLLIFLGLDRSAQKEQQHDRGDNHDDGLAAAVVERHRRLHVLML